jgi:hypothetical protein
LTRYFFALQEQQLSMELHDIKFNYDNLDNRFKSEKVRRGNIWFMLVLLSCSPFFGADWMRMLLRE